jgi:hypothetical protein
LIQRLLLLVAVVQDLHHMAVAVELAELFKVHLPQELGHFTQ